MGAWLSTAFRAHVEAAGSLQRAADTLYDLLDGFPEWGEAATTTVVAAWLSGLYDGEGGVALAEEVDPFSLPAEEAVQFFRRKRVVDAETFALHEDQFKAAVFTASRVSRRYALDHLHATLARSIEQGGTFTEYLDDIDGRVASIGMNQEDTWYWDVVFRNNIQGAYSAGRWQRQKAGARARPYLEYLAILDSKTRPQHRKFHGVLLPHDDPFWTTHYPINGHNCRCRTRSWSRRELEAAGRTVTEAEQVPELMPDPGFAGNPGTRGAAERQVRALGVATRQPGILPNTPEGLSRAWDAERVAELNKALGSVQRQRELLGEVSRFQVVRRPLELAEGQVAVEWSAFSQDEDLLRTALVRQFQTPALGGLAERTALATRATAHRAWDMRRRNPQIAFDGTMLEGETVAKWSELVVRSHVAGEELDHLVAFWRANGQLRDGAYRAASPLPGAWEVMDLRVRWGGQPGELPEGMSWAWLLRRRQGRSWVETLSREVLDGWEEAERVAVNSGLMESLE